MIATYFLGLGMGILFASVIYFKPITHYRKVHDAFAALYDACPTGFGEDRRLNEALRKAEEVLKRTA